MIKNVVFDIGAVLVDWDPRYLYREVMQDVSDMEFFLKNVCSPEWNHTLDLGRTWEDARAEVIAKFPHYGNMIDIYWTRWLDMFSGPIHETVDILMSLKRMGVPLYALSNWNDVKFEVALKEFPFLRLFDGRIVSGEVKLAKPDPEIYRLLLNTYNLMPAETLFIDDRPENVAAARDLGIQAIQFISPAQLERDLVDLGFFTDTDTSAHHQTQERCGGNCTCHDP